MARGFATLLLLAGLASSLQAQEGSPVALEKGPLISFAKVVGGQPHRIDLYIANCNGHQHGKRFWRNTGNTKLIARLDQTHLLVASYGEPYGLLVVDTATGKHRSLAEGSPHSFIAVHGNEVLYLGDNRWDKGEHYLYARSWRIAAPRRKLAEPQFDSVPIVRGNLAIGVTADPHQVWCVSLTRCTGRKLYALPQGALQVQLALAPGAQRLAIGANRNGRGHLAVVDLGSGQLRNSWNNLEIGVSPLSSFTPTVKVGWFDDGQVVSSETRDKGGARGFGGGNFAFVRRSIATGEITDEAAYSPVALYHRTPPVAAAAKAPIPVFEIQTEGDQFLLVQQGMQQPVQTVPTDYRSGAMIRLAPNGAFAIVKLAHNPKLVHLYRPGQSPLAISIVGGMDWRWLPAAADVESSK